MMILAKSVKTIGIAVLIAFIVAGCSGCAGTGAMKTPDQMSSMERAAMVLMLYNNAYSNYIIQYDATTKPLTPDQQKYFKGYKDSLTTIYPVIYTYITVVQSGSAPTADQEKQILTLIYQIQNMMLKEVAK